MTAIATSSVAAEAPSAGSAPAAPETRPGAARLLPTLDHERWLWERGYRLIAGVDEAGRGALAGPLVAAAVVLPCDDTVQETLAGLRDSKLLSAAARRAWLDQVRSLAVAIGTAVIPASTVDAVGLTAAGQMAFCRAVAALGMSADFVLADAFRLRDNRAPQLALIHGDARCMTIAAASVVAKVVRDELMRELHDQYPRYAFDQHKGYATATHRAALGVHGPCAEHRRSYAPVRAELR